MRVAVNYYEQPNDLTHISASKNTLLHGCCFFRDIFDNTFLLLLGVWTSYKNRSYHNTKSKQIILGDTCSKIIMSY